MSAFIVIYQERDLDIRLYGIFHSVKAAKGWIEEAFPNQPLVCKIFQIEDCSP